MEALKAKYSLVGVKNLIQHILDHEGMNPLQLAKLAGLHFTTLYGILHRDESKARRPIHKSTIVGIGKAVGYDVRFDSKTNEIIFGREKKPTAKESNIDELLQELRTTIIQAGRKNIPEEDRKKIIKVVKAML